MSAVTLYLVILSCLYMNHVHAANLPGPLVYVVTPKTTLPQVDTGRAAPFYYQNWMKRMDKPDSTTTATTSVKTTETPDLIFAEFESNNNNLKSIRKLLEKEKIEASSTTTSTTTSRPIYVPDEEKEAKDSNYGIPQPTTGKPAKTDMTDYFALYNNLYNTGPVYVPNAPAPSVPSSTTTTTTTTESPIKNVENIWHIIDNEKHNQFSGKWEEESINSETTANENKKQNDEQRNSKENQSNDEDVMDENFALPGFNNNPEKVAENESRAIRTEPNIRFPYVNLKPFTMKNYNSKKGNNYMFDLGSFTDVKNPVRGEVQDTPVMNRQPIDRYNPAQPYIPEYGIGTKAKKPTASYAPAQPEPQARPPPMKTVANLVPPPPPPAPKVTGDDFPTPATYDSFPPYAPGGPPPSDTFSFPSAPDSGTDSGDDNGPPSAPPSAPSSGYRYKPPAPVQKPSAPAFVPTIPPPSETFSGYSYDKPPMEQEDAPPDFSGYHYSKPAPAPAPPQDHPSPAYGHHDAPPSYQPDYPELIYDKPHGGMGDMGDMKGGGDMKANDMGMMPPPPPDMKPSLDGPPMDDHGFPHDFPGDFKYGHDFDEHDYHHHHHHHTTTTTTSTTEMPRVNRFSYYYLGKKLYYLPLYFSVYFVVYVGALIIKAVLRHKITYPNSYRPNTTTSTFFSKRSIEKHLSNENLHEITGRVTRAIATAAEKYISDKSKEN